MNRIDIHDDVVGNNVEELVYSVPASHEVPLEDIIDSGRKGRRRADQFDLQVQLPTRFAEGERREARERAGQPVLRLSL